MPSNTSTVQTIIADYYQQLAADAARVKPAASYDWEGRKVDRNEWRLSVLKAIQMLQDQLDIETARDGPFEIDVTMVT